MSEVITYEKIWQTLVKVDVSKHVEKKNGLTYLSWAWAWGVLMEHFPSATYEFDPHELHNDGTVTVHCTVRVGTCHRSMWLPVMDYKNNAIKNPDARKISDTRMRCLVKTISMFGLGHAIYAGEDIQSAPVQTDKEIQQSVAELDEGPLIDETPAVKQKRKVPTKQGGNDIPSEEGAAEIVGKLLEFAKTFCKDTNSLRQFWGENKQLIDILDSNYPKQYEALKTAFIELKSKYEGATSNG
jgi:hypothetical protein